MKKRIFLLILVLTLSLTLVLALGSCKKGGGNTDSSQTNMDTSTSTDTGTDTNQNPPAPSFYKVEFFLELYDVVLGTQTVSAGQVITPPTNVPNKDGYTFTGWYLGNNPWDFNTPVNENMTLNGKWEPNPATINFNKNGGYGAMDPLSDIAGASITMPNVGFANPGFDFVGWSSTPNGAVEYKSGDRFTVGNESEYTFYAIWKVRTYALKFEANGGTGTIDDIMLEAGEDTLVPECSFEKKFHKFIGWAMEEDGEIAYQPGDSFTMQIGTNNTMYALWEIDYPENEELSIIANGATDYVIVYEAGNEKQRVLAQRISELIQTNYGVAIGFVDNTSAESEHEIILGMARDKAFFVQSKTAEYNDFSVSVCENDLVIYSPNEYLYNYLIEVLKLNIFTGSNEALTFKEANNFRYQTSSYKDKNYAQYIKSTLGSFDYNQLLQLFEERTFTAEDGTVIPYRIYIPSSYNAELGNPVVTILHGAGERGSDNESQLKNLVTPLFNQANSPYLNSIVIAPQCPEGQQWVDTPWAMGSYSVTDVAESNELKAVYELITETRDSMVTDTTRYYIMGLSMGGYGTWDMLMRHGDIFAGAVVMCGCADPTKAKDIAIIPVHAVHGTADPTVPYADALDMAQAIEGSGLNNYTFEPLDGYGHNVWDYVGTSTTITAWLFEQSLNS